MIDPAALRALVDMLRQRHCKFLEKRCTDTALAHPPLCAVCEAAAALVALLDENRDLMWVLERAESLIRFEHGKEAAYCIEQAWSELPGAGVPPQPPADQEGR